MPPATYAPAYRRAPRLRSHVLDERLRRARKDGQQAADDSDSDASPAATKLASVRHPVNKRDPYHVAGHPREEPLPPAPFPYAAVHSPKSRVDVDAELCELNPPIFAHAGHQDDQSFSLKRRHLDNLTAILHSRILKHDWQRASRVLGLMVRTELLHHIDIRQHDRWTLAGEILLHRDGRHGDDEDDDDDAAAPEYGCQSARDLYERLILHYPYTQRLRHTVNAAAVYPALLNVWIYEVQDQSKRALRSLLSNQSESDDSAEHENEPDRRASTGVRQQELDGAIDIANRLDELLAVPPYDTDPSIRRLRGMVALWIADICKILVRLASGDGLDSDVDLVPLPAEPDIDELRRRAGAETELSSRLLSSSDLM